MDRMAVRMSKPAKSLRSALARRYSEMSLLKIDLELSAKALRLWDDHRQTEPSGDVAVLRLALFRDAVVQFIACFSPPGEHLNAKEVFGALDGGMEYYNWLRSIRDTYAAHRFGPLRQTIAAAIHSDVYEVIDIGALVMVYHGPSDEGAEDLHQFFEIACKAAREKQIELGAALLAESTKLSREQVEALQPAELTPVPNELIRMVRGSHSKPDRQRRARQKERRRKSREE